MESILTILKLCFFSRNPQEESDKKKKAALCSHWVAFAVELNLQLLIFFLFVSAYPDRYRSLLWAIGGMEKWNTNPEQQIYFYANHKESPNIPWIWTQKFALLIDSVFFLLKKREANLNTPDPLMPTWTRPLLPSWSASLKGCCFTSIRVWALLCSSMISYFQVCRCCASQTSYRGTFPTQRTRALTLGMWQNLVTSLRDRGKSVHCCTSLLCSFYLILVSSKAIHSIKRKLYATC